MAGHQDGERRQHKRGEIAATCEVFSSARHFGNYLVNDLSAGGACLIGEAPLPVGEDVHLLLQLPGRPPIGVEGRVVRRAAHEAGHRRFAVAFAGLDEEEEDALHQALVAELERVQARQLASVLVFRGTATPDELLERDLRDVGHESVVVATSLEAVALLSGPGSRFATALVDLSSEAAAGLDFLDFLGNEHPHIRRVVLGAESDFRAALAVRSGRAHAALTRPWSRSDLLSATAAND
jgi:ActR/RegA family two-component response regulator